jgi:hypothetical protein
MTKQAWMDEVKEAAEEDAKQYNQSKKKDKPIFSIDNIPDKISDTGID